MQLWFNVSWTLCLIRIYETEGDLILACVFYKGLSPQVFDNESYCLLKVLECLTFESKFFHLIIVEGM